MSGNGDVKLKGVVIGDGFINFGEQYPSYVTYAASVPQYTSLTQAEAKPLLKLAQLCKQMCFSAVNPITNDPKTGKNNFNIYDVRLKDGYDFSGLEKFFNSPEVKKELKVKVENLQESSNPVCFALMKQDIKERADVDSGYFAFVECRVEVLFYDGEFDYDCNWMGTRMVLEQMQWKGIGGLWRLSLWKGSLGLRRASRI